MQRTRIPANSEFGYDKHLFTTSRFLPSATKLQRLYFYTCLSFCPWGWYPSMHCRWYPSMPCSRGVCYPSMLAAGGVCSRGSALGGLLLGGLLPGGVWRPPQKQTATVADGTHPTGMHSCFSSKAMLKTFVTMNPHLHVTVGRISDEQQSEKKILCLNKESSPDV